MPPSSYLLASANRVSVLGQRSRSPFLDFVTSFMGSTCAGGAGRVGQGMVRQGNRKDWATEKTYFAFYKIALTESLSVVESRFCLARGVIQ
jgi:hypothetical protein